jgi:hypothetical protein
MKTFNYEYDKITGIHHPALYPGQKSDKWVLPDDIRTDFSKLNSVIETKYTREFLKICAFYNKMFPSLKTSNWTRSSYNVPPFTVIDQERSDTGTGTSSNYLKQIIDQVVARIGTISFEPMLLADVPTLEYIVYKDEVERMLRKTVRNEKMNRMVMEVFHDAAVLGYSHILIDPVTHVPFKVNDYEIGIFESQFNRDAITQLLYRDYAFPVTSLVPYLNGASSELVEKIVEDYGNNTTVDFKMYFDCPARKAYVTINGTTLPAIEYPFALVQVVTFSWDLGFSRVTSTSLFDTLYPVQRELNKVNAKLQQLIRLYKGPVPVFNGDVDLAMKSITNGTGEALYVSSPRPVTEMINVINPTPLDAELSAQKTAYKTEMLELAGIQQVSFDMENMRSAASIIALDQTRDTVFQSQLDGIGNFVKELFKVFVTYNAGMKLESTIVPWESVVTLLDSAVIDLKPVHMNDPLGNKGTTPDQPPPDYQQIQTARLVMSIIQGSYTYDDVTYIVDRMQLLAVCAVTMLKLSALGIPVPDNMEQFMIAGFIDDVRDGQIDLSPPPTLIAPGADVGNG